MLEKQETNKLDINALSVLDKYNHIQFNFRFTILGFISAHSYKHILRLILSTHYSV